MRLSHDFTELVTVRLTKIDVARLQLERAIDLFVNSTDFVSAITLVGAAEEILGKLVEDLGKKNALNELIDTSKAMEIRLYGEADGEMKEYVSLANYFSNRLKHLNEGADLIFNVDYEAASLISRALDNYYLIQGSSTEPMKPFEELNYFGYSYEL
jgi:hypothetical protein